MSRRIVTAYLGDGGASELSWLADPGIAIPEGGTAVHGITTEVRRAQAGQRRTRWPRSWGRWSQFWRRGPLS